MLFSDVLSLDAKDEAAWLHGLRTSKLSTDGYVFVGQKKRGICRKTGAVIENKWHQKGYKLSAIESVLSNLIPKDDHLLGDTYVSQASFAAQSRKISGFSRVQSAWVDLDYYCDESMHTPQEWAVIKLKEIQKHICSLGLPEPSLIIDSGRGAYVKWIFNSPTVDLPLWNAMQDALSSLFADLHVDYGARDACRVLRCLHTVNKKNSELVSVVGGSGKEYEFKAFANLVHAIFETEIAPHLSACTTRRKRQTQAGQKMARAIEHSAKGNLSALNLYQSLREPVMLESLTQRSLNWARFTDMRDLVVMRGGFEVGQRNNMLLWMANSLAHAKVITIDNWDDEVAALLEAFPVCNDFNPVESGYLSSLRHRLQFEENAPKIGVSNAAVLSNGLYRPSNQYLINRLEISKDEQQGLRTLIDAQVKSERLKQKRDVAVPGRAQRRQAREQWHTYVQELVYGKLQARAELATQETAVLPTVRELGLNISALAKDLDVERSLVSKFVSRKISDFFLAKNKFKADINAELPAIDKPAKRRFRSAQQAIEPVDAAQAALRSIQAVQQKQKRMIEAQVNSERANGQRVLNSALSKMRRRLSERAPGADGATQQAPTTGRSCEELKWAKEKVTTMLTTTQSRVPPPGAFLFKAGALSKTKPPERPHLGQSASQGASKATVPKPAAAFSLDTVDRPSAQFHAPTRGRPQAFPAPCTWLNPKLPLCTRMSAAEWGAASADGLYLVVEILGGSGELNGLIRVINPEHPSASEAQAGRDIYGLILPAPQDPSEKQVVRSLHGCTLLSTRDHARMVEALETAQCRFLGQSFWISRSPMAYMAGAVEPMAPRMSQPCAGAAFSAPSLHASGGAPRPGAPPIVWDDPDGGIDGPQWIDDPSP